MFIRVISTALSFGIIFIVVSDNVPRWANILGWVCILGVLALGVMTLKAEQIMAWCEKQRSKKNDKNTPQMVFLFQNNEQVFTLKIDLNASQTYKEHMDALPIQKSSLRAFEGCFW